MAILHTLILTAILSSTPVGDQPGDVTPADVMSILSAHCNDCHAPGGAGPFSLLSQREAKKRARQIADVAERRFMPPWLPEPGDVSFRHERRLDDKAIQALRAWAEAGAPISAPGPSTSSVSADESGPRRWSLGQPDLELVHDEPFVLPAGGGEVLHTFVVPTGLATDVVVSAIEFLPGNPRAVHHVALLADSSGAARTYDGGSPGPGYPAMGSVGWAFAGELGGWSPGDRGIVAPEGSGWHIPAGSDLVLEMHFAPTGKLEPIAGSRIGLHFAASDSLAVTTVSLGSLCIDIPPGATDHAVEERWVLPVDVRLFGLTPIARYICRRLTIDAMLPDGTSLAILTIPEWDFNWQRSFWCQEAICLPAGTELRAQFVYDNSASNPRNPVSPAERVRLGHNVNDEIALVLLHAVADHPADSDALAAFHLDRLKERVTKRVAFDRAAPARERERAARTASEP